MIKARVSGVLGKRCSSSVQSMERLFCSENLMTVANGTALFRMASLSWVSSVPFHDAYVHKGNTVGAVSPCCFVVAALLTIPLFVEHKRIEKKF